MTQRKNSSKEIMPFGRGEITQPSNALGKRGLELIPAIRGRTIRVPQNFPTVEKAIEHANDGDTIEISGGTYNVSAIISKRLTIRGEENKDVILQSKSSSRHVFLATENPQPLIIENIIFHGGEKQMGSKAIYFNTEKLTLTDCSFMDYVHDPQSGFQSEAIDISWSATLVINRCKFINCDIGINSLSSSEVYISNSIIRNTGLRFTDQLVYSNHNHYQNAWFHSHGIRGDFIFHANFDTFTEMKELIISRYHLFAEYNHCTILTQVLLGFDVVDRQTFGFNHRDLIVSPKSSPDLLFENCIILSSRGSLASKQSDFRKQNDKDEIILDVIDDNIAMFKNSNHLIIPPKYNDPDPQLIMGKNEIHLAKNSPARNRASDRTHLGAWQD